MYIVMLQCEILKFESNIGEQQVLDTDYEAVENRTEAYFQEKG